ncbi:predicted protein [Sparassis crispa]|uniref:WW domain-containing protein n=1 Tax=Sparassis crispa TaxID=139825 RepID=A0A401G7V4_9APHY|nr:predicted protein [Sparassis crispa]GBE78242.1 predicted protein [Sparassis crispa]
MTAAAAKAHERSKQHILKADKQEPWEWEPANNCQFDLSAWEPQSRTFADLRVNLINDYVPFWRDGVEAAEAGGKPTSMEIFLSRFDDDPWGWNNDSGDKASDGWSKPLSRANAADDWGSPAQEKNEWGGKGVQDKSGWGAGAVAGGGNTEEDPQNHSGWAGGEAGWDVPALVPDASRPNEDQNDRSSGRKKSGGGRVRKRKYNWADVPDRDAWTFVEKYAREEDASPERRQQMHQFFEAFDSSQISDMSFSLPNLPDGWVLQYDERTQHTFWVDTRATPPRSIWVHPYEDEQFLEEHPDIRERLVAVRVQGPPNGTPPPYSPRRHSFSEGSRPESNAYLGVANVDGRATSQPPTPTAAIGTKEEREAAKRQRAAERAAMMQQLAEERRQQRLSSPYAYGNTGYSQSTYGAPAGDPLLARRSRTGGRFGNNGFGGGGFGGGGIGLPLLGGLAGGLLLGEVLDDFGGGWGGGFGDPGFGGGWDNGFGGGFF